MYLYQVSSGRSGIVLSLVCPDDLRYVRKKGAGAESRAA